MKKTQLTLDKIREKTDPFQKDLLSEIWQNFRTKGEWPALRELYRDYGKRKVGAALSTIGKGVGFEQNSGGPWPRYHLSTLGILLTKDGLFFQELLTRFFNFQRDLFKKEPLTTFSTSAEIANVIGLNSEETVVLGHLLWLGNFGGGRSGQNDDWTVNSMEEAANFPKTGDLSAQVDKWVCRYYEPYSLATQQKSFSLEYPNLLLTAHPIAPTDQPHFSEITVSLDRLRKKYPDPAKLGFLIMRFADGKPFKRIADIIKRTAEKHNLVVVRADENEFHAHLWENVRTLLHGCGFGVAIYERIERDEPNANVGLEVGYLMAMNKPVLLLKDKTVDALQSDLAGKLYRNFDPHEPEKTIPEQLTNWLADNGIIVSKQS